jgi:hypothetical protein
VRLHEVDNPLLDVMKYADLNWIEEIRLWEVAHDTENLSKPRESLVKLARSEFGISCHGVGITERSI